MNDIGWIGLGKCGKDIAEKMAKTYSVIAYDIKQKILSNAKFTSQINDLYNTNCIFILVETPHTNPLLDGSVPITLDQVEDFNYDALSSVLNSLANINYKNPVVVSSTVSPGTIKQLANRYTNLKIVYMPVMIHIGTVATDYINASMYFIGATDKKIGLVVEDILKKIAIKAKFLHGTWEEVELYKLLGNAYSSIKIVFANSIAEMIEKGNYEANAWNVMSALLEDTTQFNSTMYMMPGSGNGGPCHPRDTVVLSWLTDKIKLEGQLFKYITLVRQQQALSLAKHLISYNLPIIILGKSFKPNVDLTIGSYSILVGKYCNELNGVVRFDSILTEPSVILLAHKDLTLLEKYKPHNQSIIIDLWNLNIKDYKVKIWGNNLNGTHKKNNS